MTITVIGFAGSLFCALTLFVCLFSNINKTTIWGRTMWISAAAYGITAFLFAYDAYTIPDLYPVQAFILTTSCMLTGVAYAYINGQQARLATADSAERVLLMENRMLTIRIIGYGLGWITAVTLVIVAYGIAEQSGVQPTFGKQLARVEQKLDRLTSTTQQQYDSLSKKGDGRDQRLNKLESNAAKTHTEFINYFTLLFQNQDKLLNRSKNIDNKLAPARPLVIIPPTPKGVPTKEYPLPSIESVTAPQTPVKSNGNSRRNRAQATTEQEEKPIARMYEF